MKPNAYATGGGITSLRQVRSGDAHRCEQIQVNRCSEGRWALLPDQSYLELIALQRNADVKALAAHGRFRSADSPVSTSGAGWRSFRPMPSGAP
jgi:hypothetical protein